MHIAYPMRIDALDKPGGDLVQVREYIAGGAGAYNGGRQLFTGEILTDPSASLRDFDLVHLTNLDRPFETYAFYAAAKAAGKKVLFSPIHHSYREIAAYERQGRAGMSSALTGRLSFRALETLRTLVRARRYPKLLGMIGLTAKTGVATAQLAMLHGAEQVLLLSWKERDDILADCPGADGSRFVRLRNGLPARTAQQPRDMPPRDIDVCVVGRIEARKNQLMVLEALEDLGLAGTFVGAENPNHAAYCKAFKERIATSRSTWLGAIPRDAALDVMRRSRVHVSASWFEVLSLVDLEAYSAGCRIVASRCGGTQDVLGDEAVYVTPDDRAQIAGAIQKQLSLAQPFGVQPLGEAPRLQLETWGDIAEQLAAIYRQTLDPRQTLNPAETASPAQPSAERAVPRTRANMGTQPCILFGVFKGMGDLLWASPVIITELDRGTDVHLLLFPNPALADFCSLIDFGNRRGTLYLHSIPTGFGDIPRFVAELRDLAPQMVWISPHAPAADSSWKVPLGLRLMQRLHWRQAKLVGADSERLNGLLDIRLHVDRTLPLPQREWSAYRLYRDLQVSPDTVAQPVLPATPPRVHFLPEISALRNAPPTYDLVIHPGANARNRTWPVDKYPALVSALPLDWKIAILGLPADVAALKAVLPAGRPIDYILITGTLRESLETLASARVLLVMNSGTMHFAEVLGVPAVAIFGQQDPADVIGPGSIDPVYERSVPCQPCGRATCGQPAVYCLTNLDPLHVAERLIVQWKATQAKPPLEQIQPVSGLQGGGTPPPVLA